MNAYDGQHKASINRLRTQEALPERTKDKTWTVGTMRWCPKCLKGWLVPRVPTLLDDKCPECETPNHDTLIGYRCDGCGLTHLSLKQLDGCCRAEVGT